jgi:hypothetical protein
MSPISAHSRKTTSLNTRAWFWQSARRRLDQLGICGKITSREREKIEAALA